MVHVSELTAEQAAVALRHHQVYKALWQDVEAKIQAANKAGARSLHHKLSPLHTIMQGLPLVSSQRAARYIRDKLVRNGFGVTAVDLGPVGVTFDIAWSTASAGSLRAAMMVATATAVAPGQQQQQSSADLWLHQLARKP